MVLKISSVFVVCMCWIRYRFCVLLLISDMCLVNLKWCCNVLM